MTLVLSTAFASFLHPFPNFTNINWKQVEALVSKTAACGAILALTLFQALAQDSPPQQDPGQAQDAEAARVKLLKAADQLDMIETGYETVRVNVDTLKKQVQELNQSQTRLEQENSDLKTQLAALQDEMKHQDEVHAAEQKELLAQVADLISSSMNKPKVKGRMLKPVLPPIQPSSTPDEPVTEPSTDTSALGKSHVIDTVANPTVVGSGDTVAEPSPVPIPVAAPITPHPIVEHGYNHTVAAGETLSQIAREYRAEGVKVTVADICKANDVTPQVVLKPGQKLFIPKL